MPSRRTPATATCAKVSALALDFAFGTLKLHRVEVNIQPVNARSLALVERTGFAREGFSRRYVKIGGRWRDHVRCALLAEDWRGCRQNGVRGARRRMPDEFPGEMSAAAPAAPDRRLHAAAARDRMRDRSGAGAERTRTVKGHAIAPYALHEECMKLVPGDRLEYHFTAGAPLHFNVHYHEGKAVVLPVSRDGVRVGLPASSSPRSRRITA